MSSEGQSGGKSGRFNAYQIDERRVFSVDSYDEVTLAPVSSHDTGPDAGVGPPKIAFVQGRKEFLQSLDEHAGWCLLRHVVRFVLDCHLIRSHEQLSVWPRTEMNALACRFTEAGRDTPGAQ